MEQLALFSSRNSRLNDSLPWFLDSDKGLKILLHLQKARRLCPERGLNDGKMMGFYISELRNCLPISITPLRNFSMLLEQKLLTASNHPCIGYVMDVG